METWNYFRIVALVWGAAALLTKPVFFNLFEERWRAILQKRANKAGERPAWILPTALVSFALIIYT